MVVVRYQIEGRILAEEIVEGAEEAERAVVILFKLRDISCALLRSEAREVGLPPLHRRGSRGSGVSRLLGRFGR